MTIECLTVTSILCLMTCVLIVTDWAGMFQSKCFGCNFPIEMGDTWIEALGQNWHAECFNCTVRRYRPLWAKNGLLSLLKIGLFYTTGYWEHLVFIYLLTCIIPSNASLTYGSGYSWIKMSCAAFPLRCK